jgi:hypothetical protein
VGDEENPHRWKFHFIYSVWHIKYLLFTGILMKMMEKEIAQPWQNADQCSASRSKPYAGKKFAHALKPLVILKKDRYV